MSKNRTAILIDGAFFRKQYKVLHNKEPKVDDVKEFIRNTMCKLNNSTKGIDPTTHDTLLRTYYFDARLYTGIQTAPDGTEIDFSDDDAYHAAAEFQKSVMELTQFKLILGLMIFNGWKVNSYNPNKPIPFFCQKGVDMKLGLEMVQLATKKVVDKIVLVAGDSDFVEPIRLAQEEGIHVYLEAMRYPKLRHELRQEVDFNL